MPTSRQVQLVRRPTGAPTAADFDLVTVDVPPPAEGEVTVRNSLVSLDPYMRSRLYSAPGYAEPYPLHAALSGDAVGTVVASRATDLPEGTPVRSTHGWRESFTAPAAEVERLTPAGLAPADHLGPLGLPGEAAYVGLFVVAGIRPGETVYVSAAAGAVGSVAGQLAKLHGCRVVGSAGSEEKVEWLLDELGFDEAFDHSDGDLEVELAIAAPDGVDVYFDNVGGAHLRAALGAMNPFGRAVLCGAMSQYGPDRFGVDNLALVVARRLRLEGFLVQDHAAHRDAFTELVAGHLAAGRLTTRETVVSGLENAPAAFLELFTSGGHTGKVLVDVSGVDGPGGDRPLADAAVN
ncbi:NADP-dependent oxidoreductase [Micromonospora maritima]|uniref:NADP-dependent oxidoreductase n=1 Tax=Micromonospora maritima TaxID=986711 RepID=UPI00157CF27D|nr:NADP-dependent oxidoreductase [Micromonospora maritima]